MASNNKPQLNSTLEPTAGTSLLRAINSAAAALQRSARSEFDVFQAFQEQVLGLGFTGGLCLIDATGETMSLHVVALAGEYQSLLQELEQRFNMSAWGFSFPITDVDIYHEVVTGGRPVFVEEIDPFMRQLIPLEFIEAARYLIAGLGKLPAIFAPLIIDGNIAGVINVAGETLDRDDIFAFEAFAHHIGIALENARLISALREGEENYRLLAERLVMIREIDQAILAARSKEAIARVGLERLAGLIPYQRASITLFNLESGTGLILAVNVQGQTSIESGSSFELDLDAENMHTLVAGEIYIGNRLGADGGGQLTASKTVSKNSILERLQSEGIEHIISVPLSIHGECIGSLNLGWFLEEPFKEDQIEITKEVADLLAVAIQDSWYLENELRRRHEAETLIGITAAMTSSLDMDHVLESILVHLNWVVPYNRARIFLLDGPQLNAVASRGYTDLSSETDQVYSVDNDLVISILGSRRPLIVKDSETYPGFEKWGVEDSTRSWMGVPLVVREKTIGFLSLDNIEVAAFGYSESELAQAIANQAAITIEHARLFAETQRLLSRTRSQSAQLMQLIDLVPDGIVLLDADLRITVANQAAKVSLGQLADARVGDELHQLGNASLDQILQTGSDISSWQEVTSLEPDAIFEVSARAVGEVAEGREWLLILRNVTDVRTYEGYLRTQERLATVGQLAAGIAHDFNNIMTVISLYTQLVLRMPELPEKEVQRLKTIEQQAMRASQLILQILDFSRQSVVERKPIDLLPFLRDLTRAAEQSLPNNIELKTNFVDREYLVEADTSRLNQAITNLIGNGLDVMPEGGTLFINLTSLTLHTNGPFPLPDMTAGDWILLEVSDTGTGIPQKDIVRIFEPFFTTKPSGEGTGLGLAQVYGIVKLHDGFIDAKSEIGKGTTFTIYLPVFSPVVEEDSASKVEIAIAGYGETIMIVEDEPASRDALAEIMESLNYKVLTAANGAEALVLYDELGPQIDLIISDMVMPVMDGAKLYRELRLRSDEIRMIVVTGYPLDRGGKEMLDQGVVAYIQKPLRVDVVARAVRDALESDR